MIFQKHNCTHPAAGKRVRVVTLLFTVVLMMALTAGFATNTTTYADQVESHPGAGVTEVAVTRSQTVTVQDGDSITAVKAYGETVGEVLSSLHVSLARYDEVSVSLDHPVSNGMSLTVDRAVVAYNTETEVVSHARIRRENPALYRGEEQVVQPGVNGAQVFSYREVTVGGETVRTLLGVEDTAHPVAEITEYGTKVSAARRSSLSVSTNAITNITEHSDGGGVLTTSSGQQLNYSKVLQSTATAYTTQRQSWKKTAIGTTARVGAIAVDPKVIPYGTRMYIQSSDGSILYGVATAEDCGTGVNGNRIDLFFNTYDECINFGVRSCTVYILD